MKTQELTPVQKIEEALKTPYNRIEMIDIIKDFAGDEFETFTDLWNLAKKTDSEIAGELENLKIYYINQED